MSFRAGSPFAAIAVAALAGAFAATATPARAQDQTEPTAQEEIDPAAEAAPASEGDGATAAAVDPEEQGAADVVLVRECLATLSARGAPARVCMDIVTRSCATQPDGETAAGAAACEERGRYAWTTLLGEAGVALEDGMSNSERESFSAAQDAWAAFRDAQCAYEAGLFEGEELQAAERIACERRLTAERAIALHEQTAEIEEIQ